MSNDGYVSSHVTDETGCGSTRAPWVIEAFPGQRLNVTMLDFGADIVNGGRPGSCDVYGHVVEPDTAVNITLCGGRNERFSRVLLTKGSKIKIHIIPSDQRVRQVPFLIRYQSKYACMLDVRSDLNSHILYLHVLSVKCV